MPAVEKPHGEELIQVNSYLPHPLRVSKRMTRNAKNPGSPGEPMPLEYDFTLKMGENVVKKEDWKKALKEDVRLSARVERRWLVEGKLSQLARLDMYDKLIGPMDRAWIRQLRSKSRKIKDGQIFDLNNADDEIFAAQALHFDATTALRAQLERMQEELAELRALREPSADLPEGLPTGVVKES